MNPTMSTLSPWAADAGQRLRELLAIGRSQGSLLVSDIHGVVDVDDLSPEVMAEVRVLLDREGILLVDDLADSGVTLQRVREHLQTNYPDVTEVRSAVIWVKGTSAFKPDYHMEDLPHNPWIHQPFEDYDGLRPHQLSAWLKKFEK